MLQETRVTSGWRRLIVSSDLIPFDDLSSFPELLSPLGNWGSETSAATHVEPGSTVRPVSLAYLPACHGVRGENFANLRGQK